MEDFVKYSDYVIPEKVVFGNLDYRKFQILNKVDDGQFV